MALPEGVYRIGLRAVLLAVCPALVGVPAARGQHQIPPYHVVFDDFDYAAAGYPDTAETGLQTLFGENAWLDRNGEAGYTGYAWYYFNWRWQDEGKTIHPRARFEVNREAPYSLSMIASEGYTRRFLPKNEVPIQIQSGFVQTQGTWVLSARFADLEAIPYFTQAFWLISPMATSEARSGVKAWSELNFEWQNWFAVSAQPGTYAWNTDLSDDAWALDNEWVAQTGVAGTVFPDGRVPSPNRRTYMANGVQMHDLGRGVLSTGETAGGAPLRNARSSDAAPFTCYASMQGRLVDIDDPEACMGFVLTGVDGRLHPWVHLMIQYDSRVARYAVVVPGGDGDYVAMESSVALNLRSLPLAVNVGIHTPNELIVLGAGETSTFEVDWFYYSPATDLALWDVLDDVQAFRERGWSRVNLDAEPLHAPAQHPWIIRSLRPPTAYDPGWIVDTTVRGTNDVEVQWTYRTRNSPEALFSNWANWRRGGFRFTFDEPVYEIELDVRAKDHNAPEIGDQRRWANAPCTRYNYETRASSLCEGGLIEDASYSLEQVPRALVLEGNYPNPFRAATSIRLGLPYEIHVTLAVYDVLGRRVALLLDQPLGSGFYSVPWHPAATLPSGTYFYRLASADAVTTRSMVLIR